jgi:hypothetical protein
MFAGFLTFLFSAWRFLDLFSLKDRMFVHAAVVRGSLVCCSCIDDVGQVADSDVLARSLASQGIDHGELG